VSRAHPRGGLMGCTNRDDWAMTSRTQSNLARRAAGSQGVYQGASARTTPPTRHRPIPGRRPSRGHRPGMGLLEKLALQMAGSLPGNGSLLARSTEQTPQPPPTKTPQRRAQVVVARPQTRAQHGKDGGAAAIQQALAQPGREPVPSQRTLSRLLHRSTKEVTSTHHHHTSVQQRATWRPVWTEPQSQGPMAT
jgi:hypothetical protein